MDREIEVLLRSTGFSSHLVLWAWEEHRVSRPSRAHVRAVLPEELPLDDVLGQPAEIITEATDGQRRAFRGVIEEATLVGTPHQTAESRVAATYEFKLVSTLGLLAGSFDCRIFQDKTTQEIVTEVLENHGVTSMEWSLVGSYPSRIYCTQYNESALHFISRLLEEDGIYFTCSLNEDGEEVTVFADDSSAAKAAPDEAVPLRATSQQNAEGTAVYSFDSREEIFSGKHTLDSFDFERPDLSLESVSEADDWADLESYRVEENFFAASEGQRRADLRKTEARAAATQRRLTTDDLNVQLGRVFKTAIDDDEKACFITAVTTQYVQDRRNVAGQESGHGYIIEASGIESDVPFAPRREHSRPRLWGPQTATVVAPEGTDPEGLHTDEYGRIKVKFHWDRHGALDETASCWMRVGQLQTSGSMILPRVDWEVVVEYVNGDPDRPLVSGRLFNGRFMPPYQLPEGKTRTSLQTSSSPGGGGTNEIRLEDAAGSEEVMIHSQYNTMVHAANNRTKTVQKNSTQVVGNNATCSIGANHTLQVTGGTESTIGADQNISVGGNRTSEVNAVYGLTVGGSSSTSISGNWMSMVGSPLDALIALGAAKAAAVASGGAEKVFQEVNGAVQGAVDQAMGPIQGVMEQAQGIQSNLDAVADGQLAASAGVLGGAVALPTASDLGRAISAGPGFARSAEGTEASAGGIAVGSAVGAATSGALGKAAKKTKARLGEAQGGGGGSAGGQSAENVAGPEGALSGFSESDTTAGPGYSQYQVSADHKEVIGGMRIAASADATNFNIKGTMTEDVGAAHIELIAGDRAESVEAASSETEPGLVVVAKGGEAHTVQGAQQLNIGGALMEDVQGDYSIEAGISASLIGSLCDIKAKGKITIQCGASSLVIDGSGVTIQTPTLNLSGSAAKATKAVSDG